LFQGTVSAATQQTFWSNLPSVIINSPYSNGQICYTVIPAVSIPPFFSFSGVDECIASYNIEMAIAMGTTSGIWDRDQIGQLSNLMHMEIFDLIGAVLNEYTPYNSSSYYKNMLNLATDCCYFTAEPTQEFAKKTHFWSQCYDFNGYHGDDQNILVDGMDYMLMYNLYRLAFPNLLNVPIYKSNACSCNPDFNILSNQTILSTSWSYTNTRKSLKFKEINIDLPDYLNHSLTVAYNGALNADFELVVCNNSLINIESRYIKRRADKYF
jgi:hypothetical protein